MLPPYDSAHLLLFRTGGGEFVAALLGQCETKEAVRGAPLLVYALL